MIWLLPYISIAIAIGLLSGTVGTYIYSRKLSSIVGGLAHFILGPIGLVYLISYFIGISLNISFFSLLSMILLAFFLPIDSNGRIKVEAEIQILWSTGMAFGLMVMFLIPGYLNLEIFLFGSLLTISRYSIIFVSVVTVLVLVTEYMLHNRFKYLGIDDDFLKIRGINPRIYHRLQLLIIVITISILLESVGILLMLSILTIPAAISFLLSYKSKYIVLKSILCSVTAMLLGIFLSYTFDLQISSTTALVLACAYFLIRFILFCLRLTHKRV